MSFPIKPFSDPHQVGIGTVEHAYKDVHFGPQSGHLSIGPCYGERSFNGAPVNPGQADRFWGHGSGPIYDPFAPPFPKWGA